MMARLAIFAIVKIYKFYLGVTHISNLLTVCVKLTRMGGWVKLSEVKI